MSTRLCAILLTLGLVSAVSTVLSQTPAPAQGAPAAAEPAGAADAAAQAEAEAKAEAADLKKLGAQHEGVGKIGSNAEVAIPEGFIFFPAKGARELMKRWGNLVGGNEDGLLHNTPNGWSVLFEFNADGYVKDDDKNELDAAKMLKIMKDNEGAYNEQRKKAGLPAQHTIAFVVPPKYNETTNHLEWAIKFTVEGTPGEFVNYNTRLLGRRGVMSVTLMVEPEKLNEVLPEYQKTLAGYKFIEGETYASYRPGDKLATYTVGGLVVSGAAFAAAKAGLFGKLGLIIAKGGKAVIAGLVAVVAVIGKFFGKLFGRRDQKQFEQ